MIWSKSQPSGYMEDYIKTHFVFFSSFPLFYILINFFVLSIKIKTALFCTLIWFQFLTLQKVHVYNFDNTHILLDFTHSLFEHLRKNVFTINITGKNLLNILCKKTKRSNVYRRKKNERNKAMISDKRKILVPGL